MALTKKSPKVTPIEVKPTKHNNDFVGPNNVISLIKFIVYAQLIFGINRTYLIKCGRFMTFVTRIYSFVFMISTLAHMITYENDSTSFQVIQYASCFEFIFLVFNSMFFQRQTFEYLIENMNMYDDILNITNKDLNIMNPKLRGVIWILVSVAYTATEYSSALYLTVWYDQSMIVLCITTIMAHDGELLLFVALIRMILARVEVMKAHVKKKFGEKDGSVLNKVDAVSNNTQLDITTMHRTYDLLHKCAEQLNSVMSLPMMISLFCSGIVTTMLLRNIFLIVQTEVIDKSVKIPIIVFCSVRCIRYTFMVIVPCYFSTLTTTLVTNIRNMLHDAANSGQLDKIEKRKVKAFFQLTREKKFAYAIWGVIRLNMSLPLSYSSLCTTYLVIIIQFSKFID